MAYTPELSQEQSCTLRRIAWAIDVPMTKALEIVMDRITKSLDPKKMCEVCRDKTKCDQCNFSEKNKPKNSEDANNAKKQRILNFLI